MKVVLLKDEKINEELTIPKGKLFNVRPVNYTNLLGGVNRYFQIIDIESPYSGEKIPFEYCLEAKEVPNKALIEQKERAQQLVKDLTSQMNKKNEEIEKLTFFVNILSRTVDKFDKEITRLKDLEKA